MRVSRRKHVPGVRRRGLGTEGGCGLPPEARFQASFCRSSRENAEGQANASPNA